MILNWNRQKETLHIIAAADNSRWEKALVRAELCPTPWGGGAKLGELQGVSAPIQLLCVCGHVHVYVHAYVCILVCVSLYVCMCL